MVAGVTFEVDLPAMACNSEKIGSECQLDMDVPKLRAARETAGKGSDEYDDLVNINTKFFVDILDSTEPDVGPRKNILTTKGKYWTRRLQQRAPNLFGRKKPYNESKRKGEVYDKRRAMTAEDRRFSKELHLTCTNTQETTDSHATYDTSYSKSSATLAFSEPVRRISMIQVVSMLQEELRVMNERSLASKNANI